MAFQAPVGSIWYTDPIEIGTYPYVDVKQTESGHFLLMDDTPNKEQIILQHGKTGTYIRMLPNGDYEQRIYGNNFSVVVNDENVVIQGVCNIEVHNDSKLHVYGDSNIQVDGSLYAQTGKDAKVHVAGNLDVSSEGTVAISAGGQLPGQSKSILLNTGSNVIITGGLIVSGGITAASVSSKTSVQALGKVFATGGLETLGGANIGFATPGPVIPPGVTTSTVSQITPLQTSSVTLSGITSDIFGPLAIWRLFSGTHQHVAPPSGGLTTPPPNGSTVV